MPKPAKITHRDGGVRWKVRFRDQGSSASETFVDRKSALDFCKLVTAVGGARARAIVNETNKDQVTSHTLGEVVDQWFEWKSARRADGTPIRVSAPYTLTRYDQLIRNQIKPSLGEQPINLVTESDVQDWIDDLADTLSAKTCGDAHSVLHAIYQWAGAKSRGLAIVDPCTATELPKKGRRVVRGLHPEEWRILYAAAVEVDHDAADLIQFLVSSGWRWSEAVAPRSMDVDDDGNDVWVSMGRVLRRDGNTFEFVDDSAKSQAGIRRTKMSRSAAAMIRRRRQGLKPADLLFTNPQGRRWSYAGFHSRYWTASTLSTDTPRTRRRILQVAKDMGLERAADVDLHWLRHTHAALMLLSGEPMAAVQKRLGHEDIRTTVGTYGSLVSDVSDAGLSALDEALIGPPSLRVAE